MGFTGRCVLAILSTLLFSSTHGMIVENEDAASAARRALIKSRRGLTVENTYIAVVEDEDDIGTACENVTTLISEYKELNQVGVMDVYGGDSGKVETATISSTCNVIFETTDSDLVSYVETLSGVISVEQDTVVVTDAAPGSWGLDRIDQEDLPLSKSAYEYIYTGSGVNVYVIDTGVNEEHKDFDGRASLLKDFTSESSTSITDGNGHGTHCSGTVGSKTYGVAKEVNIYGIKVLTSSGSGSTSTVIQGITYAVDNQKNNFKGESAVLSISLGGAWSSAMNKATKAASDAGMIVVVAAGNEDQNACNISPASAGGDARNGGVITVGATTKYDSFASYSNYGSCVDLLAPGSNIVSTWYTSNTAIETLSGTSMATPHVAGVAALLLEKHSMDKDDAQSELISLLATNKISGTSSTSTPNVLLQVPLYTGPPTPPTVQATLAPTLAPDEVCVTSNGDTSCVTYLQSLFGGDFSATSLISGSLILSESDLCEATDEDFTDKVVLVPRGNCMFYNKVYQAQTQGAKAVVLYLVESGSIFAPTYYDDDEVTILSVMIGYSDGKTWKKLANKGGAVAKLGSPSLYTSETETAEGVSTPSTNVPTPTPTATPTSRPTVTCASLSSASKCRSASQCVWQKSGKECYDVSSDDVPCTLLSESQCTENSNCGWAIIPAQSKSYSCYEATAIPSEVDVTTPETCESSKYDAAATICSDLDLTICTAAQLLAAESDSTCSFDNSFVWSSTSCGKNKYYQVKQASQKLRCKKKTQSASVRCC